MKSPRGISGGGNLKKMKADEKDQHVTELNGSLIF